MVPRKEARLASFLTLGRCPVECSGGVVTTRNHQVDSVGSCWARHAVVIAGRRLVAARRRLTSRRTLFPFRHRLRTDLIDDCHRSWFHEESRGLLRSSIKDALIVLVCVSCLLMAARGVVTLFLWF